MARCLRPRHYGIILNKRVTFYLVIVVEIIIKQKVTLFTWLKLKKRLYLIFIYSEESRRAAFPLSFGKKPQAAFVAKISMEHKKPKGERI